MTYNPDIHHRHSIRLAGYDYASAGLYFMTVCTHDHGHLFGEIAGTDSQPARMKLNRFGALVEFTWFDLINHVVNIELHEFVVMPNHMHGIIQIVGSCDVSGGRSRFKSAPLRRRGNTQALPEVVRQFKAFSARRINASRRTKGAAVWQRNYYEHIIRNEDSHVKIAEYIFHNPFSWQQDRLYGQNH